MGHFSTEQVFDNSGWSVNFGSGNLDAKASKTTSQDGGGSSAPGSPLVGQGPGQIDPTMMQWLIVAAVVVVVLKTVKKG